MQKCDPYIVNGDPKDLLLLIFPYIITIHLKKWLLLKDWLLI